MAKQEYIGQEKLACVQRSRLDRSFIKQSPHRENNFRVLHILVDTTGLQHTLYGEFKGRWPGTRQILIGELR